jgi:hypothetical protein
MSRRGRIWLDRISTSYGTQPRKALFVDASLLDDTRNLMSHDLDSQSFDRVRFSLITDISNLL